MTVAHVKSFVGISLRVASKELAAMTLYGVLFVRVGVWIEEALKNFMKPLLIKPHMICMLWQAHCVVCQYFALSHCQRHFPQ